MDDELGIISLGQLFNGRKWEVITKVLERRWTIMKQQVQL